eukprot:5643611-Prymnesium_polylepis.1
MGDAGQKDETNAWRAAKAGNADALRRLHELGHGATLAAASTKGRTPAHLAARAGQEGSLR